MHGLLSQQSNISEYHRISIACHQIRTIGLQTSRGEMLRVFALLFAAQQWTTWSLTVWSSARKKLLERSLRRLEVFCLCFHTEVIMHMFEELQLRQYSDLRIWLLRCTRPWPLGIALTYCAHLEEYTKSILELALRCQRLRRCLILPLTSLVVSNQLWGLSSPFKALDQRSTVFPVSMQRMTTTSKSVSSAFYTWTTSCE